MSLPPALVCSIHNLGHQGSVSAGPMDSHRLTAMPTCLHFPNKTVMPERETPGKAPLSALVIAGIRTLLCFLPVAYLPEILPPQDLTCMGVRSIPSPLFPLKIH